MAVSLYDLSVANYLQTLGGVEGFLAKGLTHFQGSNADPNAILDERLYADMAPFKFQVWATAHHSLGAIKGVKDGVFGPPAPIPATMDYAGLQKTVTEAREALEKVKADEVEAVQGKDMTFQLRDHEDPVHGRELPAVVLAAQLLLPRHYRLRHPAPQGRADRQARLSRQNEDEELKSGRRYELSGALTSWPK